MGPEQRKLILAMKALYDTCKEFPEGAPSSALYLGFNSQGYSLSEYEWMLGTLKQMGLVTVTNHLVSVVPGNEL